MIRLDVQQGTDAWARARIGIPTASCFDKIITPKTMKPSASAKDYLHLKLAEWLLQAPLDVIVERGSPAHLLGLVAGQAAWAFALLALCWYVQRRATAKLVLQGG